MRDARTVILVALVCILTATGTAQVPEGWTWHAQRPFADLTVTASSEEAGQWPASKAIDGVTAEPEGIWQTRRDTPESAWLELALRKPRQIRGVRIYHQHNPGYYRSVDYAIACWEDGDWRTVAEVEGNTETGWRDHPFDPVMTDKVRVNIAKSEHGFRMGLNEVELVYGDTASGSPRVLTTEPIFRGDVEEMGLVAFETAGPAGTGVAVATRTAPDAGGQPGDWSPWSTPASQSPSPIASPVGAWIQCRATLHDTSRGMAVVESLTLGSPSCVAWVDTGPLVAEPGAPLDVTVHFNQPMGRHWNVCAEWQGPGGDPVAAASGSWDDLGRAWHFEPIATSAEQGTGHLIVGGARTAAGMTMLHESVPVVLGTDPILARARTMADWMMQNPNEAIFVEGYNQRTILALYEITGEQRYLDYVREWVGWLLEYQNPAGYWPTGYGDVYFADTGSALGLLINFYKFATPEERGAIDEALARYVNLMLVTGDSTGKSFVHEGGSLGVGYHADKEGNVKSDLNKPYTIATALTGAEIFAALYYMHGDEQHKQIAVKACDWILDTMVASGQIPYIIEDWNPDGKNEEWVWERWPYDTSAYAGEGFLSAWTYVDDAAFRRELSARVRPHMEWVMRTQNADGSWARKGSGDQLRSHGVVNMLLWYHHHVQADPRAVAAVRRWCLLVLDDEASAYLRLPTVAPVSDDMKKGDGLVTGDGIATSLAGRALVDIVRPGVDCYRWKDH
ncbi:MAG: hypothetical protein GY851_30785 [bacterium]|nr:hypothetical protein [bacterium]